MIVLAVGNKGLKMGILNEAFGFDIVEIIRESTVNIGHEQPDAINATQILDNSSRR